HRRSLRIRPTDVDDHVEQMCPAALAAQRIDLPIPLARLAGFAPRDNAEFAELKALQVFGPASPADLAHELEDAGRLGARKKFSERLAGDRQLFGGEPAFPHPGGIDDVEPATALGDMEADGARIQKPAKDDKGIQVRCRPKHGSERMQCRSRLLHRSYDPLEPSAGFMLRRLAPRPGETDGSGHLSRVGPWLTRRPRAVGLVGAVCAYLEPSGDPPAFCRQPAQKGQCFICRRYRV